MVMTVGVVYALLKDKKIPVQNNRIICAMNDTRIFENRDAVLDDLRKAWVRPSPLRPMISISDNSLHLYTYHGIDRVKSHSKNVYEGVVKDTYRIEST